jgi:membrane fusion protein (multidrug efflux system)
MKAQQRNKHTFSGALFLALLIPVACFSATQKKQQVEVIELVPGKIERSYTLLGRAQAENRVRIINQEPGRILQLPYREGDPVTKGDLLVGLDDRELRAELDKAIANEEQAKTDLERLIKLQPRDLASEDEVARATTQLELTRAETRVLRTRLSETQITAPINGIISERLFEQGAFAPASSHILTLYDPANVLLRISIPQTLNKRLQEGSFRMPDGTPLGIHRILPEAGTLTSGLTVDLAIRELSLFPGQLLEIEFTPSVQEHLWLPLVALQEDDAGRYVFINKNDAAVRTKITTGEIRSDHILILQGLSPGDEVIVTGFNGLTDGRSLSVRRRGNDAN